MNVYSFQILYDYAIRNKSIDPKVFFGNWLKIKTDILNPTKPAKRDDLLEYFNDDIGYFLALLKLLMPRGSNLDLAVSKFIVYSNVSFFIHDPSLNLRLSDVCLCIYRMLTMIHVILSILQTNVHI